MSERITLIDMFVRKLSTQAKRVIIGVPSGDNSKATGLQYSIEYYAKESVNNQRSDMHKLTAKVAKQVLSDERLQNFIGELVDEFVAAEVAGGYVNSGLEDEDKSQDEAGAKVVTPKVTRKSTAKATAKKSTAKSTAKAK